MKAIQRFLLISLVPLLTQMTACEDAGKRGEPDARIAGTTGSSPSWRASQIIGVNVKNAADETIGDVEDLVIDLDAGEVLAVIISSGGFLGMGDTLSAVPVTALRYDRTNETFTTGLTKEQLAEAPQFETDAWPDYNDPATVQRLRSYRDSIGGGYTPPRDVTAPDTTAQDQRDRDTAIEREVSDDTTAMDQGDSPKDLQITQDIRSDIMDTDLSFNAKNITIITRDEKVTLKGKVESDAERQAILDIAGSHADTDNITDDLEVDSR